MISNMCYMFFICCCICMYVLILPNKHQSIINQSINHAPSTIFQLNRVFLCWTSETLPGVLGNRGKMVFISGEQRNKGQILRGTKETGDIRKQIFDFWGTGEQANLFQGNNGTGTTPPPPPPPGGPHQY